HPSEQLRQLGIPVHALGYIHSDEKVGQAYNAADLFVLPSLEDNLPNTVMEAMSCGVPVAAFAAGGIPEMVSHGKNGLLIEPGNVTGLAANLIQLISNPAERETFGKTAREEVLARFPLSRQGEAYLELYRAVAAKMNDDSPATEETMTMAPAGPEVSRIVAASAPRPLQSHLYSKTNAFAQLQKERDAHVGTLHQQLEYLSRLKKENDELRQQLEEKHEEVNRQQKMLKKLPVKILRALKIV
ncbi:MAG: glycosyltransferase, partial [Verrucomicrobiales bacterium]